MRNIRRDGLDNVHVDGLDNVGQGFGNLFLVGVPTFEMSVKATRKGKDYTYAMTMSRLNKETPALTPAERSMPSSLPHQLNALMTTLRQAVTSASAEWGPIEPAADYHLLAAAQIV